jgi:transcriptional regulator with XRE-family HTH domain
MEPYDSTSRFPASITSEVIAHTIVDSYVAAVPRSATSALQSARFGEQVGMLLREWRRVRRISQLQLALQAGVSARHLSYVETGKARPSRDLASRLADVLGMPLRERNALLVAAGFAPIYPETSLETPALAAIRRAIDLTLEHHEPFPALVIDRHWEIVRANSAFSRLLTFLIGGVGHMNVLRQVFDPRDMRKVIVNWQEVAGDLIHHVHDQVVSAPSDVRARALLDEVLAYPDVPAAWRTRDLIAQPAPLLTVVFRTHAEELRFFSTIATFATPRDVTLDELRIECMFPSDEATAERCRALAGEDPSD